jgi:predicted permease
MSVLSRFAALFRSRRLDRDLDDELRSHIEFRIEENISGGMTREEARRDALRRFGNRALIKEETRRMDLAAWLDSLLLDLRFAVRMLRKSPVFTFIAVITLTLGIGANTAIFTLTHAILLKDLPVADPDKLVVVTYGDGALSLGLSYPMYDELRRQQSVFSSMFAWSGGNFHITRGSVIEKSDVAFVSGDTFPTLGLNPAAGRLLSPADDLPGAASPLAVLSYAYWFKVFNGSPQALGSTIMVDRTAVTIVGVLPANFQSIIAGDRPDILVPYELEPVVRAGHSQRTGAAILVATAMGRRKPGVSFAQARADIERLAPGIIQKIDTKNLLRGMPMFKNMRITALPGRTGRSWYRLAYERPLLVLQGLVGVILLICCANLAGLLAARASSRRREFAVRGALGAARFRLVRQLLVEAGMLAAIGAGLGLLVAQWGSRLLASTMLKNAQSTFDLRPNLGVLLFTTAVSAGVALLAGLPSGLRSTRVDLVTDMKEGALHSRPASFLDRWLVAGQVALAAILLVAAGLFAGTVHRLLSVDPGFSTEGVLIVPLDLTGLTISEFYTYREDTDKLQKQIALTEQMIERLPSMPGVRLASAEVMPPIAGYSSSASYQSRLPDGSVQKATAWFNNVGPGYFAAAGTQIYQGRDFLPSDNDPKNPVVALNRSAARLFFPNGNALGSELRTDTDAMSSWSSAEHGTRYRVVAVVQDQLFSNLRTAAPAIVYEPFMQLKAVPHIFLVIRTSDPAVAAQSARKVLRDLAPAAPWQEPITMREQIRHSIGRERAVAMLAIFFAALALLLTGIGVYGLLSYDVIQRTREIGIRLALGARQSSVLGAVLRQAAALTITGLAAGLALSIALGRFVSSLLFGVQPLDFASYVLAAGSLAALALLASFLPARRATRVDPMIALRYE